MPLPALGADDRPLVRRALALARRIERLSERVAAAREPKRLRAATRRAPARAIVARPVGAPAPTPPSIEVDTAPVFAPAITAEPAPAQLVEPTPARSVELDRVPAPAGAAARAPAVDRAEQPKILVREPEPPPPGLPEDMHFLWDVWQREKPGGRGMLERSRGARILEGPTPEDPIPQRGFKRLARRPAPDPIEAVEPPPTIEPSRTVEPPRTMEPPRTIEPLQAVDPPQVEHPPGDVQPPQVAHPPQAVAAVRRVAAVRPVEPTAVPAPLTDRPTTDPMQVGPQAPPSPRTDPPPSAPREASRAAVRLRLARRANADHAEAGPPLVARPSAEPEPVRPSLLARVLHRTARRELRAETAAESQPERGAAPTAIARPLARVIAKRAADPVVPAVLRRQFGIPTPHLPELGTAAAQADVSAEARGAVSALDAPVHIPATPSPPTPHAPTAPSLPTPPHTPTAASLHVPSLHAPPLASAGHPAGGDDSTDHMYHELLSRLREEQEQLGQIVDEPF